MATKTVGIRLDEGDQRALEGLAKARNISPGTLAKELVSAALTGPTPPPEHPPTPQKLEPKPPPLPAAPPQPSAELRALAAETAALRAEMAGIRRNIWNLAVAFLVHKRPLTATEANQWAKDNLTK